MASKTLPLENMRKFHNYIKKLYLDKYVNIPSRLLDLASGKGGDILKWKNNKNIKFVQGYDIDTESIEEARNRLKKLNVKKKILFNKKDLSKNPLLCKDKKYDIITSYFAFHYFFKNKGTIDTILKTINNCSKQGTYLILALFDGSKVESIENDLYKIKKINNKSIEVYIKESVLDKPAIEYLVDQKILEKKLNKIGFELVEMRNFSELINDKYILSEEEKKLSFLNNIYVFLKK